MNFEVSYEEDGKKEKKVSHDAALAYVAGLMLYLEEEDDALLFDKIVLNNFNPKQRSIYMYKEEKKELLTEFSKK